MPWLLFGHALAWWSFAAVGIATAWPSLREAPQALTVIILAMAAAPLPAAWLGAEIVNLVSPRRTLDRRVRSRLALIGVGVLGGLLGVFVSAAGLIGSQEALPDVIIVFASALAGSALLLATTPRLRAGACIHCGYDLAAATPAGGGLCPECGRAA